MADSCKICGNQTANKTHRFREIMFGLGVEFRYLECGACGCLQLMDPPKDMSQYYPAQYYGFHPADRPDGIKQQLKQCFRRKRNKSYFDHGTLLGRFLAQGYDRPELRTLSKIPVTKGSKILDVGCGSGTLLQDLRELGFANVLGIDLFIPSATDYGNGVRVLKGSLSDLAGTTWDVVMFHHSFEHIPDPFATLQTVACLLSPGGQCVIHLPVANWAWQHYGANWVQLDAPRHFFLHSEKSLHAVAEAARLKITRVDYDSTEFQFWGSELCCRSIAIHSVESKDLTAWFSRQELTEFRVRSQQLNREGRGDQAAFYLTK